MSTWMGTMNAGFGLVVKAAAIACLGVVQAGVRRGVRCLRQHSTVAQRAALRQLGLEAAAYVEHVFAHLPPASKMDEAIRYALRVAQDWGLQGSLREIQAQVALGLRGVTGNPAGSAAGSAAGRNTDTTVTLTDGEPTDSGAVTAK